MIDGLLLAAVLVLDNGEILEFPDPVHGTKEECAEIRKDLAANETDFYKHYLSVSIFCREADREKEDK